MPGVSVKRLRKRLSETELALGDGLRSRAFARNVSHDMSCNIGRDVGTEIGHDVGHDCQPGCFLSIIMPAGTTAS